MFKDGKPHGMGNLMWKNGESCVGHIEKNLCKGSKTFSNGTEQLGEFRWNFEFEDHQFVYSNCLMSSKSTMIFCATLFILLNLDF